MSGIFMLASVLLFIFGFAKLSALTAIPSILMYFSLALKEWKVGVVLTLISVLVKTYLFRPDKGVFDFIVKYAISINLTIIIVSVLMLFVPLSIGAGIRIFKRSDRN